MARVSSRQRAGFTLIELLVVVAIIAVMLGLLLPAVQKVRETASRTKCVNNLKQMGLALHNYEIQNEHFPAGYYQFGMYTYTGWQLQLLPYVDQMNMWNESVAYLSGNQSDTDFNSYPAVNYPLPLFICPTNTRPTIDVYNSVSYEITSYMGCSGTVSNSASPGGLLYYNASVTIGQITDGSSNTIAVGERPCSGNLFWGWGFAPYGTGYGDGDTVLGSNDAYLAVDCSDLATNVGLQAPSEPYNTGAIDTAHYWSFHDGGANFLFCDGSVHFLSYSAESVFPALCTIAGGETVALPF